MMKKSITRIFLFLLAFLVVLFVAVWVQSVEPELTLEAKTPADAVYTDLDSVFDASDVDSLMAIYGNKKEFPKGYELQMLLSLSRYPELKDVAIAFELTPDVSAPLESNFDLPTLLRAGKNRRYRVLISNDSTGFFKGAIYQNMPFDAQVGIVAHELAHTLYYHRLNLLEIGKWGLSYLTKPSFQRQHERGMDKVVIHRGFGWQLMESSNFFGDFFKENAPEVYEQFLKEDGENPYLSPKEIREQMAANGYPPADVE